MIPIQQAAATQLAAYLRTHLPGVTIEDQWPDPDKRMHLPTVTLIQAGVRRDMPLDVKDLGWLHGKTTYQIRACEQQFQVDVWGKNPTQRDDILARLDDIMNSDPTGTEAVNGLILPSTSAQWPNTYFDYYCESPDIEQMPFTQIVHEYRATLVLHAWMMLTVQRDTALQTLITFQQNLNGTDFT